MIKPWSEVTPHIYMPDYQAMGDCRVCGHAENQPWHLYGMGTNSTGCTEWERDYDPVTEQPIEEPAMTAIDMSRLDLQKKEFDTLVALTKAYNALPPVVDDDYPEMRFRYETALRDFIYALEDNGRLIRVPK